MGTRTLTFRRRRRSGTSLVEVMIAMAILAFVLLAFLSIMSSSSQMSANSKEAAIASYIVQSTMEDIFSTTYQESWEKYFENSSGWVKGTGNDDQGLFKKIQADSALGAYWGTAAVLAAKQQSGNALTPNETLQWATITDLFKKYSYPVAATNRLRDEKIAIYLLPGSDIYSQGKLNPSMEWNAHGFVEFMLEVTWTDASGKPRRESVISRRSQ